MGMGMVIDQIIQLMTRVLITDELRDNYEDIFDILINTTGLLDKLPERLELAKQIKGFKETPRGMITTVVNKCQDVNRTLGHLIGSFIAIKKENSGNERYATAMTALTDGMNTIAEGARKKSEEQATKELANDKKFRTFMKFLIDHQPDGMKKYANAKGYRRDTFLELARAKQILPGDMIGFYRKKLYSTINYTHAGIYAPYNSQGYVIHLQQKGGKFAWGGVNKCAEVKCEKLEEVLTKDDCAFIIREGETCSEQADILSKVEACLFEEAIECTYNSLYGSCQTFCSKILGANLYSELNFEVAHEDAGAMKAMAGWILSDEEDRH